MIRAITFIPSMLAQVAFAGPAAIIRKIEPLSVRGVNYFPRNTPWNKMWTEMPNEVWAQDMAAAAKVGGDTVRTFLRFNPDDVAKGLATADGTPTPAYHEKLQRLLEAGSKHGIRFVLCFEFSPHIIKAPDAVQRWQRAMRSIVFPLRDDGRVLMWDLMNEPESNYKWTEPTKAYLRGAKVFIKEAAPHHLTPIGITFRTHRLQEIGLLDVLQYHHDGTSKKTLHLGTEPVRQVITRQRMEQTERPAIGGALAWCLYDFPIKNPNEPQFGLIRLDGSEKPAAQVLRDAFKGRNKA